MKVIGFTGPAGAGKDTAARMLAEHLESHGLNVRLQAWADKLKVMAARSLGFDGTEQECVEFCDDLKVRGRVAVAVLRHLDLDQGDEDGLRHAGSLSISGREFLEFLGTEGGRNTLGQNVWVDAALPAPADPASALWRAQHGFPNVVIDTTTRFPNEAERIREWGGKIIRIERAESGLRAATTGHPSRAGVPADECDNVIENDGTLEDLEAAVIAAFHNLETMPV